MTASKERGRGHTTHFTNHPFINADVEVRPCTVLERAVSEGVKSLRFFIFNFPPAQHLAQ